MSAIRARVYVASASWPVRQDGTEAHRGRGSGESTLAQATALYPRIGGVHTRTLDAGTHPPLVRSVEFVLDSPTEEDLVESFPVFLVSEQLGASLTAAGLVGFTLDDANVHPSTQYVAVYGDLPRKAYRWLRLISSSPSDCWLDEGYRLCVSDRMYSVIARHKMEGCEVTPTT